MRRPDFADFGRFRRRGFFSVLGLQPKAAQGFVKLSAVARRAAVLRAQGVAGDGRQFFAGPLT